MKTYQYRIRPVGTVDFNYGYTVLRAGSQERLTGQVQGMKASDLEERVGKALDKLGIDFSFRVRITSEALGAQKLTHQFANVRGEVEIDMLCDVGGQSVPVFVDGEISHFFTPYQADMDKVKTDVTDEFGKQFDWRESIRLPFWKLIDQDMADRTVRDALRI